MIPALRAVTKRALSAMPVTLVTMLPDAFVTKMITQDGIRKRSLLFLI
jgi:hypothetical protein